MQLAVEAARSVLAAGGTTEEAGEMAKRTASFAGEMRRNLVSMLDALGLPRRLGVGSTLELFGDRADLLHSTSAVRYPVFVDGDNYTGHAPPMLKHALLRRYVEDMLAAELAEIPAALVVPCGDAVSGALRQLASMGKLDPARCLFGFPHPSGANGWRRRHFEQRRAELATVVAQWPV